MYDKMSLPVERNIFFKLLLLPVGFSLRFLLHVSLKILRDLCLTSSLAFFSFSLLVSFLLLFFCVKHYLMLII